LSIVFVIVKKKEKPVIQPIHDLVFIEKKTYKKLNSVIELPENFLTTEHSGIIVSIGPGKTYSNGEIIPLSVNVGDEVIYSQHAGQTFRQDGKEYIAIREHDIYAIIARENYDPAAE
jgi:chaperonin GroES